MKASPYEGISFRSAPRPETAKSSPRLTMPLEPDAWLTDRNAILKNITSKVMRVCEMDDSLPGAELTAVNDKIDDLVKTIKNLRFLVGILIAAIIGIFLAGFAAYPHIAAWNEIRNAHSQERVINTPPPQQEVPNGSLIFVAGSSTCPSGWVFGGRFAVEVSDSDYDRFSEYSDIDISDPSHSLTTHNMINLYSCIYRS